MKVDYLVVGQGLAGSLVACLLFERGRKILVVDDGHRTAASQAAAGIINPITGKRLNRPLLVDALLGDAFEVYPRLEILLNARFFARRVVRRILASADEARYWARRRQLDEYRRYLACPDQSLEEVPRLEAPFGAFAIESAAQLDVPAFIRATRRLLATEHALLEVPFDYTRVRIGTDEVWWNDVRARHLIFCEGYRLVQNPFFNPIELNPAKGEILTLTAPAFQTGQIVQGGKWLFRSLNGEVLAGTTYHWDQLDETISEAARLEIEKGLRLFFSGDYQVTAQRAGVRPVIRADNRPVAGLHPQHRRLAILNGLGSKGALQAPFAARQLIAKIEDNGEICPEIDACREFLWKQRRSA
ncbi:MAG: FAD-binding oxidoreductase [Verrucomicrobia bacterium]|nr:FAD-binding oxidoreductase [Verrucomicrobiota bacterium]